MITEQQYFDALKVVRTYMAQINGEIRESNPDLFIELRNTDISFRCFSCCCANDIYTIGDLVEVTERQLLRTRNCGKKTVMELKDLLSRYKLKLKHSR